MTPENILNHYPAVKDSQEELYIDLHRHPELSMREDRTRGVIVDKLTALGYDVVEVGGGVVGTMTNGEGPTVMLRADFDGLPVKEETGLPYASTDTATDADGNTVPVMHACGHDVHVASLVAMGEMMAAHRGDWSGTLQLLFQPGEENGAGARAMVADGLVDKVARPDVVLGQYVFCDHVPAGHVALSAGPVMATSVNLEITLYGEGSHGSMPHLGVDPVVMASAVVQNLQTIVARVLSPFEFGVVTVGTFHAGTRPNVIPDSAHLGLNVRAYDAKVRERILAAIERIVRAEARAAGAKREPEIVTHTTFPVLDNDECVTERVRKGIAARLGAERIHPADPLTGSEDFPGIPDAFRAPYCYWYLGGAPEGVVIPNHSPAFAPLLQPTLETGAKALAAAALAYLG
ncbi:amidohydrolase [Corynebacterium timonense]|uniref:Hippurate hydrolase n=1 Tax=Corynebacterium timonense TaxID=441500 RepID=A0A1H1UPD7_9CORY|nr:amidohydrolase [Corynebacterium timonense]SDS73709.1 hippurate hydrolase [Corynebacterium timonense]